MSKKSGNRLTIKIKVSVGLTVILSLLHLGAFALLFLVDMETWLRVVLAALLLASLYRNLTTHALRSASGAIRMLRWEERAGLSVQHAGNGDWRDVDISSRFIHRWLVLLSVKATGERIPVSIVLLADAVETNAFRRLRAALLAPPGKREA